MIEFVREMNKSYVKISEDNIEKADSANNPISGSYCMKMIENNDIEQFIRAKEVHINDSYSWMYDISGMSSIEDSFDKATFSYEQIMYVMGFFKAVCMACERYMLDMDGIILDVKYIFRSTKNNHWKIIYNVVQRHSFREELKRLFEYILSRLDHKDQQAVITAYGIYKCICDETQPIENIFENFSGNCEEDSSKKDFDEQKVTVVEKKELLVNEVCPEMIYDQEEIKTYGKFYSVRIRNVVSSIAAAAIIISALCGVYIVSAAVIVIIVGYHAAGHFLKCRSEIRTTGRKMVYSDERCIFRRKNKDEPIEENIDQSFAPMEIKDDRKMETERTMLLGDQPRVVITVPSGGRREVSLYDRQVIIGSGEDADIRINEQGVSRNHAKLTKEGDFYFIKDLNSTNGTRVNDHLLNVYELCRVMQGDKIYIAGCTIELIDMYF